MTTNLDLLKTIHNATISLPIKQRINPEDKKAIKIAKYYGETTYCEIAEKVTQFTYTLSPKNDMVYKYNIDIYKTDASKFLGFTSKKERYILKVHIYEVTRYNTGFRNEYFFDTEVDKTPILKDIFNFLVNRNIELNNILQSEKFELYVNDLSKLIDKSVTREETLNKILDKSE